MIVSINNKNVEVANNQTILDAIKSIGLSVPTLCHINGLFPSGACRMCIVELEGVNNLIPSCSMEIQEGMKIKTHSPRVLQARKQILELLLANHPDDCLYCNKSGFCELQMLSEQLGIDKRAFRKSIIPSELDISSASISRDSTKCILCGRCVRVCEEIQDVSAIDFVGRGSNTKIATAFDNSLNTSTCINCGQCIMVCPTGALTELSHLKKVINALNDPETHVVIQHAPSISVTLGEYFNLNTEIDIAGRLNTALRHAGFDKVFDTSFTADLTILEEASELVDRIKNNKPLPMFTSCSPGWIKFVEHFYPQFLPNISTCKSPQQMMGALIKSYYAEKEGIDPSKIFSVSIMPCTAKKFEAKRPELMDNNNYDIDASLTTREIAKLLKMLNIDLAKLTNEPSDNPLGERSSAGKIFGSSGGVMEAALRTAYFYLTGKNLVDLDFNELRGNNPIKELTIELNEINISVAVVSGLHNARKILDDICTGRKIYHFVEIMTCPGGCIAGGGQPYGMDLNKLQARMNKLYKIDETSDLRLSHENPSIKELYKIYLKEPLGEKSHELLHTSYHERLNVY